VRFCRDLVAIDETVIKLENEHIYVWVAIDVDTKECLAVFNIARISQK